MQIVLDEMINKIDIFKYVKVWTQMIFGESHIYFLCSNNSNVISNEDVTLQNYFPEAKFLTVNWIFHDYVDEVC